LARVILSSVLTGISGSLSNCSFSSTRRGTILKKHNSPLARCSTAVRLKREAFARLQYLYSTLPPFVKAAQDLYHPSLFPAKTNWQMNASLALERSHSAIPITPPNSTYPTFWSCYVRTLYSNKIQLWGQSVNEASDQYMVGYSRKWSTDHFDPYWLLSLHGHRRISYHTYEIRYLSPLTTYQVCLFPYDATTGDVGQSYSFIATTL